MSPAVTSYVLEVAPSMSMQLPPVSSQRCHWYASSIGCVPVHLPKDAPSVSPSVGGAPESEGGTVFAGGSALAGGTASTVGVAMTVACDLALAVAPFASI